MRHLLIIISLFYTGYCLGQTPVFKAKIKSLANGDEIMYAKVTNQSGLSKLTNVNGMFEISYSKNTLLTISHLSYDTLKINTVDFEGKKNLVFYMRPKVYDIAEVRLSILGERSLFDNKFVNNDLGKSDREKVSEKLNIAEMKKELIGLDRGAQGGMVLGSPITYLYDRFSKAGKERIKYQMLLARDKEFKETEQKFDDLTVTTLTNYNDKELEKFKEFCSFHPSYIQAVDALQLYFEILRCRDEYVEKEH